jgi:dGTP triphosphohydrolase
VGERFLRGTQPSLEAQITNMADEIAYNNHDIDDGLRAGLLDLPELCSNSLYGPIYAEVQTHYPDASVTILRHETGRRLINLLINDLVAETRRRIQSGHITSIAEVRASTRPLAAHSPEIAGQIKSLKSFLFHRMYRHPRVHRQAEKAKRLVRRLFHTLREDPRLLPLKYQARIQATDQQGKARIVADYIAGMTDRFAIAEYDRLFDPHGEA